ncbi:glutathione S-transferase domain-containing protein [Halioglobus maricola]|uniref:Glutathione S-transferase domain-containing protein n=1 Tax=Halioglobus maricola TaxID=2601894 RepID=A0A5P9NMC1_9GAMM|nr:glutathione binding-like protein [Halioglobus maricola]QFU76645.1 glutathione S-transferase domain-containing protein [Halioglobus maricola]
MTNITFWGVTASPYQLKMQSLADYAEAPWQRLPDQANPPRAIALLLRLKLARQRGAVKRFPQYQPDLDEYPEVPYYSLDGRQFYYDSTGLALHLDAIQTSEKNLLPADATTRFLCRLIDDAFDEFGLYMVHHNRWITSAHTNVMASMTTEEMRSLLPPVIRNRITSNLAQRQVRRCPYLFSVAPEDYSCDISAELTPPPRIGFPATHELLDKAWRRYLAAMEHVLEQQPYLLGERFTLADASAYGQLGMNLVDGRAADIMRELAPQTFQWLNMIRSGQHRGSTGTVCFTDRLTPLLHAIADTHLPLMRQNEAAYEKASSNGQQLFNEAAFDRNEALYDGSLLGLPFRSVIKSFQVSSWRELCEQWLALKNSARQEINTAFPFLDSAAFTVKGVHREVGTANDQAALD